MMTKDTVRMNMAPVHRLLAELSDRNMRVNSLIVHWRGRIVLDLWQWPHAPEFRHKLHSATKSFTATAVGFAEAEGLLQLEDPVVDFFADLLPGEPGENLLRMRIRDLLTMRTGHARGFSGQTTRLRKTGWVEEFFEEPVLEPPGRSFQYSSTTSHLLSAIVQRVTGQPVDEYLRPLLFDPLGITDFEWERDPDGICTGGNGLTMRPHDLLQFGLLHLHDGVWHGSRVLPAGWVQKASAQHVRRAVTGEWNGTNLVMVSPEADDDPGYGYQFWTSRDGIYSASGIFGQECMVFPEQGGVVVVTGAMGGGSYHDLPEMMRAAFRDAFSESDRVGDSAAGLDDDAVRRWVARVREPDRLNSEARLVGFAESYDFEDSPYGLRSLSIDIGDSSVRLEITDERGSHVIDHGIGHWVCQDARVGVRQLHHSYQDDSGQIAASAQWTGAVGDDTLLLTWHFIEGPFIDTLKLRFDPQSVVLEWSVNVNSGPTELPAMKGHRRGAEDAVG